MGSGDRRMGRAIFSRSSRKKAKPIMNGASPGWIDGFRKRSARKARFSCSTHPTGLCFIIASMSKSAARHADELSAAEGRYDPCQHMTHHIVTHHVTLHIMFDVVCRDAIFSKPRRPPA